jgi:elongator complex protein 6
MPPTSRIPELLQPYTRLPKGDSFLLLTSTLGASANWLIIRFLCEALQQDPAARNGDDGRASEDEQDFAVVLVSWMRDWEFWKSEARKAGGLDLERLKRDKRLAFVDGLSGMFTLDSFEDKTTSGQVPIKATSVVQAVGRERPQSILPVRGPPGRIPSTAPATRPTTITGSPTTTPNAQANLPTPSDFLLKSPELKHIESTIESAIRHVQSTTTRRKILLVLDTPSILLACHPVITPMALSSTLLHLHSLTSHVLIHVPADDALLSPSAPPQPVEISGHNFLVKMAHMSSRILSCRVLDTGVARDVSGVLRITENRQGWNLGLEKDVTNRDEARGREMLYLVKGDGSVRMFERGAGES